VFGLSEEFHDHEVSVPPNSIACTRKINSPES
jgi:hypothetical protein